MEQRRARHRRDDSATDQEGIETRHWWTAAYNRPRSRQELDDAIRRRVTLTTSDGPYARTEYLAEKLVGKVVGVLAPDRHTRDELSRRIYAAGRPKHLPPTDYSRGPEPGYIEPAGSAEYHRRTGLRRKVGK